MKELKGVDLYCGTGGWSDGLSLEGFKMLGVEIQPDIAKLYKHDVIVADVTTLDGSRFQGFDVIVGSPPCRDFSIQTNLAYRKGNAWTVPPDPEGQGLKLVKAFLKFVEEANPTYWLMENVPRLSNYLDLKPRVVKCPIGLHMRRNFWGNFPPFLIPTDLSKKRLNDYLDDTKWKTITSIFGTRKLIGSYLYARIPLAVSKALGRAIKQSLLEII